MKVGLGEILKSLTTIIATTALVYKCPVPIRVHEKLVPFGRAYTPRMPSDPIEKSLWNARLIAKPITECDLTQQSDIQMADLMLAKFKRLDQQRQAEVQCAKCQRQENLDSPLTGIKLSKCARCRVVQYCSKECQIRDWPVHKAACKCRSKVAAPERLLTFNESISRAQAGATFQATFQRGTTLHPCMFGMWLDSRYNEPPKMSSPQGQ